MITECDSYHIQICSVSWEDLTGMYKVKKEFNKQISFLVMPKRYEMGFMQEKIARRDLMEQGFEYDGVRKYQEGDRISRVHWNLYAATGGLWVRKNEEEEEERVKIGLSLDDIEKDRISDYMAAFYSISFFLKPIKLNIPFVYLCFSGKDLSASIALLLNNLKSPVSV